MAKLRLTMACWDYDRTRALSDRRVQPEGVDLNYLTLMMPESFFRMLRFREFDVGEMSLSWYTRTLVSVERPFIAIPVFPSRMFRHSGIYVHASSGIETPKDLVGRRVGVPEYQMTAAVWIKGMLAEHYGVPVASVSYHTGGLLQPGRTETPLSLPPEIRVQPISAGRTLSEMIETGELDALYTAEMPEPFARRSPKVRRLFPDYKVAEQRYFSETGIFPIMHTVVVKRELYEAHRWVARSLFKAFEAARDLAYEDLRQIVALKTMLPWLPAYVEETRAMFGSDDYWPYGLRDNERVLGTFLRYSHEQGILDRLLQPEELFAPETLEAHRI